MKSTPVSVPMGTSSIVGESATMKMSIITPAVAPERRPRAPFMMLMVDWPIIASPPIAPKTPETAFARPCATHSWFERNELGSHAVISSHACSVMTDSMSPTKQRETAYLADRIASHEAPVAM